MTAQEIKDLIASKIAGQGSAVDAGSALPEILNNLLDNLEAMESKTSPIYIDVADPLFTTITDAEKAEIKKHLIAGDLKNCLLRSSATGQSVNYTEYAQIVNWVHNDNGTGFIMVYQWMASNATPKKITI